MTFAAPLWLLALVPWAGVALYLLRGRRRSEHVPFLGLWLGPVTGPPARHKAAAPPLAVALALLATVLALLGAAGPVVRDQLHGAPITIVLDRGATMSARGVGRPRYVEAAEALARELPRLGPLTSAELVDVPGQNVVKTDVSDWISFVPNLRRTAVDTADALRAEVARRLAANTGLVFVVSDRPLGLDDSRLIQLVPASSVRNAGITLLAARETPRPQVMVRVRNDTPLRSARLEVTTAGERTTAEIELPAPGADARDKFVDVPRLGDVVVARLVAEDSFEADNVAWLVRGGSWPRIEPRAALSPELARMVEVYGRLRSSGSASASVAVVDDPEAIPPAMAAVVVAPAKGTGDPVTPAGPGAIEVMSHPVTRNLEAGFRTDSIRLIRPAPAGWTPVVRIGGNTAVAVRDGPVRRVWVGLDSAQLARQPEYVVFWTNVFDWLGGSGGVEFRGYPVGALGAGWKRVDGDDAGGTGDARAGEEPGLWPGLYERADDRARRGVNALDVHFPPVGPATTGEAEGDWRRALDRAAARVERGVGLGPALIALALWCVTASVLVWGRAPRAGLALPTGVAEATAASGRFG